MTQSCHGMVRRSFATNMATCPGHALSYMKLDGARLEHHHRDLGERSFKLVCLWLCTADHFSMCLVTCFACIQLAGSVMQWHRLFFQTAARGRSLFMTYASTPLPDRHSQACDSWPPSASAASALCPGLCSLSLPPTHKHATFDTGVKHNTSCAVALTLLNADCWTATKHQATGVSLRTQTQMSRPELYINYMSCAQHNTPSQHPQSQATVNAHIPPRCC